MQLRLLFPKRCHKVGLLLPPGIENSIPIPARAAETVTKGNLIWMMQALAVVAPPIKRIITQITAFGLSDPRRVTPFC